ncbi:MAG: prolipoprotein diacylglyceryl transferase [Deltaproteobacteria bacterium]|nr:prolipoprotein diacylglyceryl transferase [Deltaproteobacteria bacterium]
MHPTFHLGPLEFPAYFTFLTIGYLAAVMLAWRETFRTKGVDPNKMLDLAIVLLITGLLGSRILHVIADGHFDDYVNLCLDPFKVEGRTLPKGVPCITDAECLKGEVGELCNVATGQCHPGRDCLRTLKIWYGGLAFYGGLLLCIPVGIGYILRHKDKLDLWKMADLAGFGIPLGLILGRVGCWFAGCCFGEVDHSGCGVVFPKFSPAWDRHIERGLIEKTAAAPLPVIPSQLIQIGLNAAIFLYCYWLFKKRKRFDGQVFWMFMLLYAVARFGIEFYRDDHRGIWLGDTLSTSQLLGIPVVIGAAVMLRILSRRQARNPEPLLDAPGDPLLEQGRSTQPSPPGSGDDGGDSGGAA